MIRKFGRKKGQRVAFMKGLAHNLITKESIDTTVARAKSMRPMVERLVSVAKKQHLAGFRSLLAKLPKASAEKLFYEIAPRYKERKGGYLRITKKAITRKRDNASLATIEFVK
ncbi:MAG: 50S ribosomal protein L17 [bacterium]|nr:50S ribosomal protein L17 [bacterium]